MCKILEKLGFKKIFGKGSHVRFKHPDGRRTVVSKDVGPGLLTAILKQVKLTREDFQNLIWDYNQLLLYSITILSSSFMI